MSIIFRCKMALLHVYSLYKLISNKNSRYKIRESLQIINSRKFDNIFAIYSHYHSITLTNFLNNFVVNSSVEEIKSYMKHKVSINDSDIWEKVNHHDGPVLFVTPHYGPFGLGCLKAVSELGNNRKVNAFYDPPEKNPTSLIYKDILSKLGPAFVPIFNDRGGVIKALRALKRKEILAIMPDVYELSSQSIAVPFFGHLTTAMAGTAFLAIQSKAIIVQAYCEVNFDGSIDIILEAPIKPNLELTTERSIYQLTTQLFASMENQIRHHPEHWLYLSRLKNRLEFSLDNVENNESFLESITKLSKSIGLPTPQIDLFTQQSIEDK